MNGMDIRSSWRKQQKTASVIGKYCFPAISSHTILRLGIPASCPNKVNIFPPRSRFHIQEVNRDKVDALKA